MLSLVGPSCTLTLIDMVHMHARATAGNGREGHSGCTEMDSGQKGTRDTDARLNICMYARTCV
jgi:hypothetical protein